MFFLRLHIRNLLVAILMTLPERKLIQLLLEMNNMWTSFLCRRFRQHTVRRFGNSCFHRKNSCHCYLKPVRKTDNSIEAVARNQKLLHILIYQHKPQNQLMISSEHWAKWNSHDIWNAPWRQNVTTLMSRCRCRNTRKLPNLIIATTVQTKPASISLQTNKTTQIQGFTKVHCFTDVQ